MKQITFAQHVRRINILDAATRPVANAAFIVACARADQPKAKRTHKATKPRAKKAQKAS